MTTKPLPFRVTLAAIPVTEFVDVGIGIRESMTVPTVRKSALQFHARSAPKVLSVGHRLKMGGINASPISAKVVELKPLRNVAYQKFVTEAMGWNAVRLDAELPVALTNECASPKPTSVRLGDKRPEALFCGAVMKDTLGAHREPLIPGVMGPDGDTSRPLSFYTVGVSNG